MDGNGRLTVAQWVEWAQLCKQDGRDDLMRICLSEAACLAAESEQTVAEMLLAEVPA